MIPENYRRVWRRRLGRRPLLPWLLAVTLAGDLLAQLVRSPGDYLIPGVFVAQAILLAVWLASSRAGFLWRSLLVLLGLCVIGSLLALCLGKKPLYGISLSFGGFAHGIVVVAIGFLSRNVRIGIQTLPEGRSLVVSRRPAEIVPAVWRPKRWSISALLLVTTIAAVFAAVLAPTGMEVVTQFLLRDGVFAFFSTPAAAVCLINETARRSRRLAVVSGVAACAWLLGSVVIWWSEREFDRIGSAASYQMGIVSVALAWLVGLRVRRSPKGDPDGPTTGQQARGS